jgi:hypothetical protein
MTRKSINVSGNCFVEGLGLYAIHGGQVVIEKNREIANQNNPGRDLLRAQFKRDFQIFGHRRNGRNSAARRSSRLLWSQASISLRMAGSGEEKAESGKAEKLKRGEFPAEARRRGGIWD